MYFPEQGKLEFFRFTGKGQYYYLSIRKIVFIILTNTIG